MIDALTVSTMLGIIGIGSAILGMHRQTMRAERAEASRNFHARNFYDEHWRANRAEDALENAETALAESEAKLENARSGKTGTVIANIQVDPAKYGCSFP